MPARSVEVLLEAKIDGYISGMGKAAEATERVADAADDAGKAIDKGVGGSKAKKGLTDFVDLSKQAGVEVGKTGKAVDAQGTAMTGLAKSTQKNREEWSKIGGVVTAVGAAWTGLNVAVAKTGIEYNTLQQTSRAALKSILGDAEAVNAQMDELNEFATTSPFSKATFITAQQQMLAFGIEAEKVVPYLDAINDATAAAGGNNGTIAELSFIMAQISAAGKITAQDLMQFGQRGVNAAELIGSQMGKTAAQIRDDITSGALDADDALDALAAGMKERFDGASANVKETMGGAMDRVTAAWRDLSATIMEPWVSAEGGGILVDLANKAADFLRAIGDLPEPVKQVGGVISGLGGAATLAAGGFLLAAPRIVETGKAVRTLAAQLKAAALAGKLSSIASVATPVGLALVALGTIVGSVMNDHIKAKNAAEEYASALALGGEEGEKAARDHAVEALAIQGVAEAMEDLGLAASTATDAALGDAGARQQIVDAYDAEIEKMMELNAARLELGDTSMQDDLDRMVTARFDVVEAIDAEAEALGRGAEMQAAKAALAEEDAEATEQVTDATHGYTAAMEEANTKTVEFLDGTRELPEALADFITMVAESRSSFVDLAGAYDEVSDAAEQAAKDAAQAEADRTEDSKDSWEDFYEGFSFSVDQYIAKLQEQVAAQENWESNMTLLAGRVSGEFLGYLASLGPESADYIQMLVDSSGEQLEEIQDLWYRSGGASSNDWAAGFEANATVFSAVGAVAGDEAMQAAAEQVESGEATLAQIIEKYDLAFDLDADGNPALAEANRVANQIRQMKIALTVDAQFGGSGISPAMARYAAANPGDHKATGGRIFGIGTTTSDSNLIWGSVDEYMIRADAARRIGYDRLDYMNRTGELPGYATGGRIGANPTTTGALSIPAAATSGAFSTAGNGYVNNVTTTYVNNLEGREAMSYLITQTRDADLNRYATMGVHDG